MQNPTWPIIREGFEQYFINEEGFEPLDGPDGTKTNFLKPGTVPNLLSLCQNPNSRPYHCTDDIDFDKTKLETFLALVKDPKGVWNTVVFDLSAEFERIGNGLMGVVRKIDALYDDTCIFDISVTINRQTRQLIIDPTETDRVKLLGVSLVVYTANANIQD